MYFNLYGLKEKPFSLSADPRYLYFSRSHKEALSQMIYAASEDSGFLVLTGRVGTGKTIMINTLIDRLPKDYRVAKIYHTALNPKGLVQNICKEFGLDFRYKTTSQLVLSIQDFLKWTYDAGERSLLILDEAQDLNTETLEEVRLLSNFESDHKKILQMFLVGQPELEKNLEKEELRQFKERVSLNYRLSKLDREETFKYIACRLAVAGEKDVNAIFTKQAIDEIHELCDGIPRRINILCENALLMGYAENCKVINVDIIKKVSEYHPAEENFADVVERELNLPALNGVKAKKASTSPVTDDIKIIPPQSARRRSEPDTTVKATPPGRTGERGGTARIGGNGSFDYKNFQSFMDEYLYSNQMTISQKSSVGKILFYTFTGFMLLVLSFLTAIYIAIEFGIIK